MNQGKLDRPAAPGSTATEAPGAGALLDFLCRMALFSELPQAAAREVATHCVSRSLDDGAYLFHESQPSDRIYFVAEGDFDVLRYSPAARSEVVLNRVGRGAMLGEIGVLRGEARSASVRAVGKALVHGIEASTFLHLLRRFPELAITLARVASHGMVESERRSLSTHEVPVWVVVCDDHIRPEVGLSLARAAQRHLGFEGRPRVITVLAAGAEARDDLAPGAAVREQDAGPIRLRLRPLGDDLLGSLAKAEASSALVVVAGTRADVEPLLRRAAGLISSSPARPAGLAPGARHLQLIGTGLPTGTAIRRQDPDAACRAARLLLGRSIGVALGGGGAFGYAHLGVLQALAELHVPVDFIAATSMGAVMAGFYLSQGIERTMKTLATLRAPRDCAKLLFDMDLLSTGTISGRKLTRWLAEQYVATFDLLPVPLAIIATDVAEGEEVVLRQGCVVDAVRASLAIPGVFAPHTFQPEGDTRVRTFVDGGCVNNVPVDVARAMGADRVIGVHVLGLQNGASRNPWRTSPATRALGAVPAVSRLRTVIQSQLISMSRGGERQVLTADVPLMPNTQGFLVTDFWKSAELIRLGHATAMKVSEQLRALAP